MPFNYNRVTPVDDAPVASDVPTSGFSYKPTTPQAEDSHGLRNALLGGGAAVLGGGALLMHNPGLASKIGKGAMDLRQISMLSGLAPLKSLLGNVGGSAMESISRGSMAPIREMLSSQTAREAIDAFKAGSHYADTANPGGIMEKLNLPGRVMGALDTAAQGAYKRAGMSGAEAAAANLQAPLPETFSKALDSPAGRYFVPFRRTPFNQFAEGFSTMKPSNLETMGQKAALGTSLASGYATGAEVDDPKSIALGTAAMGRYGLPFAGAAAAGRYMSTGSKRKAADVTQGLSPVSDYSLSQGVLGPLTGDIMPKPAAIPAIEYLKSLLGL